VCGGGRGGGGRERHECIADQHVWVGV
jgi:hypothetical protein